jgi:hypothetical protein
MIYETVPRVFHSPTPTTNHPRSIPQGQSDYGSRCFRPTVKPLSNQASTKQNHHILILDFHRGMNIGFFVSGVCTVQKKKRFLIFVTVPFCLVLKLWGPTSAVLAHYVPQAPVIDVTGLQSHSNADTLNRNASKQKLTEKQQKYLRHSYS